ncbi:hypothetical protein EDD27_5428 [Nonomuraea polychroma]|uniref:Uncharacterized protein n=1 Tax=Nonomuraea polychroma TaxID=46176 RepID=A0A438MAN4_9ACTN|nr:hypothetical protein [Nonomuraea polychroma]RVX42766.1 hypothetical protein EDD27_5428 [Nonomuraea polychroma]
MPEAYFVAVSMYCGYVATWRLVWPARELPNPTTAGRTFKAAIGGSFTIRPMSSVNTTTSSASETPVGEHVADASRRVVEHAGQPGAALCCCT